VVRDGEGYMMWYTGVDPNSRWSVCLATSKDGLIWTKHPANPVLTIGPDTFDDRLVGDPSVIVDQGIYKMWYSATGSSGRGYYKICYATSEDGVTWTKSSGPVLEASLDGPDNSSVRGPSVMKSAKGYEMWYRGIPTGANNWTICYATSLDGVTWERYPGNPVLVGDPAGWDSNIWFPRVVLEEDRYSMWYVSDATGEVGYAYMGVPEAELTPLALGLFGALLHRRRHSH
jgi:sucrose-6-phosphate hydrolase SacC (GH32 family)